MTRASWGSGFAVRMALTPLGERIDRFCVRLFAHSPVVWIFTRAEGVPYNRPLLLTTIGRKTGRPHAVVLPCFEIPGGRIALVASRGGMPTDPHWARNLDACPRARIHWLRDERPVRARRAEGEERDRLWAPIVARSPIYARYAEKAAPYREIPLFVLENEPPDRA